MQNADLFQDNPEEVAIGLKLLESHRFWSRKRFHFNIIVGVAGASFLVLLLGPRLDITGLFGIVCWGVLAIA